MGVARIIFGDGIEEQSTILSTASHRTNMIKRPAQWDNSVTTDTAIGRFETRDATACGWDANRDTSICTDSAKAHASRNCRRCTPSIPRKSIARARPRWCCR